MPAMPVVEPPIQATYNLGINTNQLGIGRIADQVSIKNVYVDVDDTHIKVAPFDYVDYLDDNDAVIALPPTTIGSAYQAQFYSRGRVLLGAYFEMPSRDCFLHEIKLQTAMPARENYPEGQRGKDAYQSAIDTGVFEGTEAEWAQWIKPTIGDVDLTADIKTIKDVVNKPAGTVVPSRIGGDILSLSTVNTSIENLDKILTQTGGAVEVNGVMIKTLKQATNDALNVATAPIFDFVDADKDTIINRPLGLPFNSLNHYLDYLNAIKSFYAQSNGVVTVNGVTYKSIGQIVSDTNTIADNTIAGITQSADTVISGIESNASTVLASSTKPIFDFVDADKAAVIERPIGLPFKPLNYYLDYLDGIQSVFDKPTGTVTVNGVQIKAVQQVISDAETLAGSAVNAITQAKDAAVLASTTATNQVVQQSDLAVSSATTAIANANALIATNAANATATVNAAIEGVAIDANLITDALVTTAPIGGTLGESRTQLSKNRESVSLRDFFTQAEHALWLTQQSTFNVSRPLQEFFDYISANDVGVAYCSGKYRVSQGITLGGSKGCATKTVVGELEITVNAGIAIHTILSIQPSSWFTWVGSIAAVGSGGGDWASRLCTNGIVIGGSVGTAGRNSFGRLRAQRVKYVGILIDDNCSLTNIASTVAITCGSSKVGTTSLGGTYTHAGNTGGSNSHTQRTTLAVSTLPIDSNAADAPFFIVIDGEVYSIRSVNTVDNKIEVFPWVDTAKTSGDFYYVFGGGVHIRGRDSSVINIDVLDSRLCAIGLYDYALYASVVKSLVVQHCGIGLVKGYAGGSANWGGSVGGFYTEANTWDILQLSDVLQGFTITSKYELDYDKIITLSAKSSGTFARSAPNSLTNVGLVGHNGAMTVFENSFSNARRVIFSCTSDERFDFVSQGNSVSIELYDSRIMKATVRGQVRRRLLIVGTGEGYAPTGVLTFTPTEGYTVNGSSTPITYSGFTSAADFEVVYNHKTLNYMVTCKNLSKTQNTAFAAKTVAAGEVVSTEVPSAGARIGDFVELAFTRPLLGLRAWGEITADGELTVYLHNPTALPVTTTAMDVRIKLN